MANGDWYSKGISLTDFLKSVEDPSQERFTTQHCGRIGDYIGFSHHKTVSNDVVEVDDSSSPSSLSRNTTK